MKFNQGENSNRKLSNRKLSKKELCKQKFEYTSKLEYNFKGFPVARGGRKTDLCKPFFTIFVFVFIIVIVYSYPE